MRRWVLAATAMIAVGAVMVVTSRVTETCPASWEGAQRVEISGASANAYIRMDAFPDVNSPLGDAGPSDRIAAAAGPEWAAGDQIDMEGWLQIGGQRFVVVFPSFVLIKGG